MSDELSLDAEEFEPPVTLFVMLFREVESSFKAFAFACSLEPFHSCIEVVEAFEPFVIALCSEKLFIKRVKVLK